MAGRKTKPTKIKVIQGTFRKDRENKNEPTPETHIPEAPDHLSKEALVEWGRMSQELYNLGLISNVSRGALAIYCQAWARMVKYEKIIVEKGELYKTPNGSIQTSPAMWIVNKCVEQCHKMMVEFGMTPASAAKVTSIKTKKKEDPWTEYGS